MKNTLHFFIGSGLCIIICLWGCTNDKPIQGFDFTNSEDLGTVSTATIKTIEMENSFKDSSGVTGDSPYLFLGAFHNTDTKILIKFGYIADSLKITNATIQLRTKSIIGPKDTKSSFTATVHKVISDWDELSVNYENFQNVFEANPIGTTEILSVVQEFTDDDSLQFEKVGIKLNEQGVDLIKAWQDTTSEVKNYGVLIDYSNSSFIKKFHARSTLTLTPPFISLEVLKNESELDTVFVSVAEDAFLVQSFEDLPSHPLYVDHIFSRQSFIKFDFSEIPRESTVNRVNMEMNIDHPNSFLTDAGFVIQIQRLQEEYSSQDSTKLDPDVNILHKINETQSLISIPDSDVDNNRAFIIMIQDWISQKVENHGFVIRTLSPGRDVSRVAFVSSLSDSIDGTNMAPKINLDFSIPPTIPYNK